MKRICSILLTTMILVLCFSAVAFADRGGFNGGGHNNGYDHGSRHSAYITYKAHVSNQGWQSERREGDIAGTTGQGKSIEALYINLHGTNTLRYCVYVDGLGWSNWVRSGEMAGTTGEGRPIKAIMVDLDGMAASRYDVMYQVHVANRGWLDWTNENGVAGDYNNNIEAIRIVLR